METILLHSMAAFVSFYKNNSFHTTLNDAFMGKTDGFLSWTPNWDQNLQFLPLREMMGISAFYIWEPPPARFFNPQLFYLP